MKFSKEFLRDKVYDYIEREIIDHSRWSVHYRAIFEHEGKLYATTYSVGATESQDERPYDYEVADEIDCPEVVKAQKTITVYEERNA